ncbi:PAS domain S-box protein [Desulfovibrio subterraneus]|uniref:histidine kinase n=1 Tax=Desulfovibrio subterraneus TaxID=2718620 RepID=A0A7J0BL66_9BACT|nr:PAS domain S-box protein [Desulfovibrio subterraneus]GFM34483.1 hypothetical protein DSM101010T_28480 [Desulfovibrio subterraneus]
MQQCDGSFSVSLVQAVFERLPVGIMVIDPTGTIVAINQALCGMVGLNREFAMGKGWVDIFEIDHKNLAFHQVLIDVIHGELPFLNRSVSFERKDGSFVDLGILSSFIKDEGKMLGIAIILQDMTVFNARHEDERGSLERIATLVNEREVALLNLAGAVAHQVRNPVTVIGGLINQLLREAEVQTSQDRLEIIREESIKLEGIVKELAGFVSIHVHQPEWVSPLSVFSEWLTAFQRDGTDFTCTIKSVADCSGGGVSDEAGGEPSGETLLWADVALLGLIFAELVANTRDFAPKELAPAAVLSLCKNSKTLRLVYEDNTNGIAEHILPYVFDPFFTTKSSGVGMGLCKVRRAMMVMGGTARLLPAAESGVCVQLEFPLGQGGSDAR